MGSLFIGRDFYDYVLFGMVRLARLLIHKRSRKGAFIDASRNAFTSESVTEGHPDKICDMISDAVLDAIIADDRNARVACETAVTTGLVLVMGEITTECYVDIPRIVRETIREIGYDRAKYGFDCDTCAVITSIDEQSPDIAVGVNQALEARLQAGPAEEPAIGAGDQGMMFGLPAMKRQNLCPCPFCLPIS